MRTPRALLHAMRNRRIGHAEADRLVAGDHPGHAPLQKLLDAARAPATADELSGEMAAVAAFSAHRRRAARAARRPARVRTAVVTIAAGLALLSLTGTAVAARTGNLPQGAQQHAHRLFSALGVPAPRTGAPAKPAPSSAPTPAITELTWCDAWRSGAPTPLTSDNRRKLVAAAGSEKDVDRYCTNLRRSASAPPATPAAPSHSPPQPPAGASPAAPPTPGATPPTPAADPSTTNAPSAGPPTAAPTTHGKPTDPHPDTARPKHAPKTTAPTPATPAAPAAAEANQPAPTPPTP